MPPRRAKAWTETQIAVGTAQRFANLHSVLLEFQPATNLGEDPEPADALLTDDAKEKSVVFYNRHAAEAIEFDGDLATAWSKLEGYAARLALVVHCVRQAAGEPVD
ncbi:MAG TPA: DUF3987 domain-containing protein, partial [Tepidisphaeraceae bacterium]|nr:DUF3987 domain-containing protein [Tepidisphaeraceae bacterium]